MTTIRVIDFETSAVALPFYAGMRPYEQIAFQFSHHVMHADGSIEIVPLEWGGGPEPAPATAPIQPITGFAPTTDSDTPLTSEEVLKLYLELA